MPEGSVTDQVRTASMALLLGAIAAVAVATTIQEPSRAVLPLVGVSIVLLGVTLYVDAWSVPPDVWPAPLVAAVVVFLNADPSSIVWTSVFLGLLSAIGAIKPDLPAKLFWRGQDEEDAAE